MKRSKIQEETHISAPRNRLQAAPSPGTRLLGGITQSFGFIYYFFTAQLRLK